MCVSACVRALVGACACAWVGVHFDCRDSGPYIFSSVILCSCKMEAAKEQHQPEKSSEGCEQSERVHVCVGMNVCTSALSAHARVCENATHLEKRIRDIIEVCLEVHDDDADEVAVACAETFHRVVQLLGNKLGRVTHRAD